MCKFSCMIPVTSYFKGAFFFPDYTSGLFISYPMDMCNIPCGASGLRLLGQNTIEEQFSLDKPDFCHLLVYIVGLRGVIRVNRKCRYLRRQSLSQLRLALLFVLRALYQVVFLCLFHQTEHQIDLFSDKNIESKLCLRKYRSSHSLTANVTYTRRVSI